MLLVSSTFLSASSCKKSDASLDSTNPLLPKLSFRSSPEVRQVATHPKELNNICERVEDFTSALSSSPDKPGDISGVAQQAEYDTLLPGVRKVAFHFTL